MQVVGVILKNEDEVLLGNFLLRRHSLVSQSHVIYVSMLLSRGKNTLFLHPHFD